MLSYTRLLLLFAVSFLLGLHASSILGNQQDKPDKEPDEDTPQLEVSDEEPDEEPETTFCLDTLATRYSEEKEFIRSLTRFLKGTDQDCIEVVSDQNQQSDRKFNIYVIPETTVLPLPQNQRRIIHGRLLDCLLGNRSCLNINKQAMGYWYQDGFSGGLFIPATPEQNNQSQETLIHMLLGVFRNLLRLFLMLPEPNHEDCEDATGHQERPIFRSYRHELRRRTERRSRREQASNPYQRDKLNRDRSRSPIRKPPKPDN